MGSKPIIFVVDDDDALRDSLRWLIEAGNTCSAPVAPPAIPSAGGDGMGPDLMGVTKRRGRAWLARWLAEQDPKNAPGSAN